MQITPSIIFGRIDNPEDGGHVRDGYTLESYQKLLEPMEFKIEKCFWHRQCSILEFFDRPIRTIRNRLGDSSCCSAFSSCTPVGSAF